MHVFRFEWDPSKSARNLFKHGIDFELAATVFQDRLVVSKPDNEHSDLEERWITLGEDKRGQLLVVCHTYNDTDDKELIRIISARPATRNERIQYESEQ